MLCFLQHTRLGGGALEVGDEVVPLSRLLEPSEHHLGSRDVLLGVLQVGEKGVFSPLDALVDVGLRIRVSLSLAGLTTEEAVQVGALLMSTSSLDGVTLGALGLENLSSLGDVSHGLKCKDRGVKREGKVSFGTPQRAEG